jgi:hypothetical protein
MTIQYLAGMQIFTPLFLMNRNELKVQTYRYVGFMLIALTLGIGMYRFWMT